MIEKQLLSSLPDFGLRVLALPPASDDGAPLERGRAAVEDEHGLRPEEQELANAAEEAEQVRVADHLSSLVPHRLHELHHPDTGIDGELFPGEGLDGDAATDGSEEFP